MNWFSVFGFITGLLLGSLTGVLVDRSLKGKSFWGRSYCSSCKKNLKWYDLFPIFSYLYLHGKCRYCGKVIPKETIFIEIISGLIVGFLFWNSASQLPNLEDSLKLINFILTLIFKTFFIVILLAVALTDLKKNLIPDRIIIPGLWIGFTLLVATTAFRIYYIYRTITESELGRYLLPPFSNYFYRHSLYQIEDLTGAILTGLAIGLFFLLIIILTRGKGMGGGDVKLGAFIGLGLGFPNGVLALFLSFIFGAISAIFLIIIGKKSFGQTIPFGPFLVMGALTTLFWGDQLLNWYFSFKLGY